VVLRLAVPGMNRPIPSRVEEVRPPAAPKGLPWRERDALADRKPGFDQAVAIAPDGKMIAVGNSLGGVAVFDRVSGKQLGQGASDAGIAYLTFAPKGQKIISTTFDRGGQVRVAAKGTAIGGAYAYFRDVAGYGLDSVALTPNSAEVAGAGGAQGKEVVFWNAETGRLVKTVRGFPDPLTAVALSPDGKRVAAGSIVGPVRQVDLTNPRDTRTMQGHTAEVRAVAYSPDGKTLATAGVDGTIKLWGPSTGKEVRALRGHTHVVLCLAFSPDGQTLVSGGADGTLRVWGPTTGKERGVIPARRPGAMVYALAFAPDGQALAAACGEEVRQWDIGTTGRQPAGGGR
jgi:WD40 repeat protein